MKTPDPRIIDAFVIEAFPNISGKQLARATQMLVEAIETVCGECGEIDCHSCNECGETFTTKNEDQIASHLCDTHFEAETYALKH